MASIMIKHIKLLFLLLFIPSLSLAWEETVVHQHYTKWVGVLPQPYNALEVEISLNPENDDLELFTAVVGNNLITLSPEQKSKLKNLELGTLRIAHEIYRSEEYPDKPEADYFKDWIHIYIEQGERHRIERVENGKTQYYWGKNQAIIDITMGKDITVYIREFGKLSFSPRLDEPPPAITKQSSGLQ